MVHKVQRTWNIVEWFKEDGKRMNPPEEIEENQEEDKEQPGMVKVAE
jgi:hypothetical protein